MVYTLFSGLVDQIVSEVRCLFVLSNGMIGSGPLNMEQDDVVYLLTGRRHGVICRLQFYHVPNILHLILHPPSWVVGYVGFPCLLAHAKWLRECGKGGR